jgi:predicted membrane protein
VEFSISALFQAQAGTYVEPPTFCKLAICQKNYKCSRYIAFPKIFSLIINSLHIVSGCVKSALSFFRTNNYKNRFQKFNMDIIIMWFYQKSAIHNSPVPHQPVPWQQLVLPHIIHTPVGTDMTIYGCDQSVA